MCDTLCVRGADQMWFAKNSDREPTEAQVVEWHASRAAGSTVSTQYLTIDDHGACGVLGSRPTWLWGFEHGVNEHRVAIGNEKIWTTTTPRREPRALIGMDLVRLGLERAGTADDALEVITTLLEAHGQAGSGEPDRDEPYFSSFLIVDPHGGWVVETSDRTWVAKPVGAGTSLSNRITLRTDWTRGSADCEPGTDFDTLRLSRMPTAVADHRLAVTRAVTARGADADFAAIVATLRDHTTDDDLGGFSVCMHQRAYHSQTTAAIVAELRDDAPLRAWVCLGNPCLGIFVPVFPPAVAPELADPTLWQGFAALRDRIEAHPAEGEAVRAALRAAESELWERAETAFASGDRSKLDRCAREGGRAARAALAALGGL